MAGCTAMAMSMTKMAFLALMALSRSIFFGEDFVKKRYKPQGIKKSTTCKRDSCVNVCICSVVAKGSHPNVQKSKFKNIKSTVKFVAVVLSITNSFPMICLKICF